MNGLNLMIILELAHFDKKNGVSCFELLLPTMEAAARIAFTIKVGMLLNLKPRSIAGQTWI